MRGLRERGNTHKAYDTIDPQAGQMAGFRGKRRPAARLQRVRAEVARVAGSLAPQSG